MRFGKIERIIAAAGGLATAVTLISIIPDDQLTVKAIGPPQLDVGELGVYRAEVNKDIPDKNFLWVFGDGTNDTGQTVEHRFMEVKTFNVDVYVTESKWPFPDSGSDGIPTVIRAVNVANPVKITVIPSDPIIVDEQGIFEATVTGGKPPYSYLWDFGDNSTSDKASDRHSYSQEGRYTVAVTVTDDLGSEQTDKYVLTVTAIPRLTVTASVPAWVPTHETIDYTAEAHGGKPPYGYEWEFQGEIAVGETVKHSFDEAKTYRIKVTVTDSRNNTDSDSIMVEVRPPELHFTSFSAAPGVFMKGQAICAPGVDCSDCGYSLTPAIQFPPCKFADISGKIDNTGFGNAADCLVRIHISYEVDPDQQTTINDPGGDFLTHDIGMIEAGSDADFYLRYSFPYSGTYDFTASAGCDDTGNQQSRVNGLHLPGYAS